MNTNGLYGLDYWREVMQSFMRWFEIHRDNGDEAKAIGALHCASVAATYAAKFE